MSLVVVRAVASYEDREAIRLFVRQALALDPAIETLLRSGDPSRLIVVKPNWVQEAHQHKPDVWEPMITHPSVLLILVEELAEMMQRGTISICDAPHGYALFDAIVRRGGFRERLKEIADRWPTLKIELLDLRRQVYVCKEDVIVARVENPPDPRGYVGVNLGKESLLCGFRGEGRFYGADYDTEIVNSHHHGETQEYLLAGTAMKCDLFINVPKMKTHKKTGITCCLKNLVGINGDKNWLPHHTEGTPESGGDEFPGESFPHLVERILKRLGRNMALKLPGAGSWLFRKVRNAGKTVLGDSESVVRNGNWEGNDTCWRMALDLNRALLYGNADGSWRGAGERKPYLAIVDGIIGGEGNGPLCPDPAASGALVCGTNPAAVDAVVAALMGFDIARIPLVQNAFSPHPHPIHDCGAWDITVEDSRLGGTTGLAGVRPAVENGFKPHFGWQGLRSADSGKARGVC